MNKNLPLLACFLFAKHFVNARVVKAQPLFNGTDFKGWYTFLTTKGKNSDSEKVLTVSNNMLHLTRQEFGYMRTEKLAKKIHLVVES